MWDACGRSSACSLGLPPPPQTSCLLGEVGQVLGDLGNEGQSARSAVIRVLLQETEEGRGHDSWAEEAEEQGGTDQPLADVLLAPAQALLLPRCKHLLQLTREHAEKE